MTTDLTAFVPKCAACGKPMPLAHGRILWEYWGLDDYPEDIRARSEQIVKSLEGKQLCWSCVCQTWVMFAAFLKAKGDLSKLHEALEAGPDADMG
jgi:hypothetical protein